MRAIDNLEARRNGLERYDRLQRSLLNDEVASNRDFQKAFNSAFPSFRHFTDVKKLDLFLWQSR